MSGQLGNYTFREGLTSFIVGLTSSYVMNGLILHKQDEGINGIKPLLGPVVGIALAHGITNVAASSSVNNLAHWPQRVFTTAALGSALGLALKLIGASLYKGEEEGCLTMESSGKCDAAGFVASLLQKLVLLFVVFAIVGVVNEAIVFRTRTFKTE